MNEDSKKWTSIVLGVLALLVLSVAVFIFAVKTPWSEYGMLIRNVVLGIVIVFGCVLVILSGILCLFLILKLGDEYEPQIRYVKQKTPVIATILLLLGEMMLIIMGNALDDKWATIVLSVIGMIFFWLASLSLEDKRWFVKVIAIVLWAIGFLLLPIFMFVKGGWSWLSFVGQIEKFSLTTRLVAFALLLLVIVAPILQRLLAEGRNG